MSGAAGGVGRVWIVGGGPGDPGLITVAGLAALRAADVVLFDRLASRELLEACRPDALRVDVGKVVGDARTQERIHALLVEHARAGRRVVRLHGGDSFVFGRGAEELAALSAAGVPATVVPGVSSAIAAAVAAGIPITARGVAASFAVATGREAVLPAGPEGGAVQRVDWARLAGAADTLVALMGAERLAPIAAAIVTGGRDAATPCAVVEAATTSRQRVVHGTLATIAGVAEASGVAPPAVLVVGDVTTLAAGFASLRGPLAGRRVLVTRARTQAGTLAASLRAEGALPVLAPALRIEPAWDERVVSAALERVRASAYEWIAFASENGVEQWWAALAAGGLDTRALAGVRVCAIGGATADALAARGVRADLVPGASSAAGAAAALLAAGAGGTGVLLAGAAEPRAELAALLRTGGAVVDELVLYRTVAAGVADAALLAEVGAGLDAVTLASPSAVRGLVAMLGGDVRALDGAVVACIGPTTAEAAVAAGLAVHVVAAEPSVEALVAALRGAFGGDSEPLELGVVGSKWGGAG